MTADEQERVYFIGGTGFTGTTAIEELLKKKIHVTVYSRSPEKVQKLFGSFVTKEDDASLLTIVEGNLDDLTHFESSIQGHTRLYLVVNGFENMVSKTTTIAQKAYSAGVQQIVHISSGSAQLPWRSYTIGTINRATEEGVLAIPNRGAYVALRPTRFMSNIFLFHLAGLQNESTVKDLQDPNVVQQWISNRDIGLVAANILQDPIEKHKDAAYRLVGDLVTPNTLAKYLSEALGRPIQYVRQTPEERYEMYTKQVHIPHSIALDLLEVPDGDGSGCAVTPGISILLGRKPETLEHWIQDNKAALL